MKHFLATFLLLTLVFSGCAITSISDVDYVDEIKIGFIGPLSGEGASYGIPIKNAVEMAVADINNNGGIKGKDIVMTYEDGECTEAGGSRAATKLIFEDKIKLIIGGVCSGETLAAAKIADPAGAIMITPSSSSPVVTMAGDYIFRNTPSDADLGKALASMVSRQYKKVAIFSENTEYAIHLEEVFTEELIRNGGEVVEYQIFYDYTTNFQEMVTKALAAKPEAIFINPQSESVGGNLLREIYKQNNNIPLYGTNVLSGATALKTAGEAAEGIVVVDNPPLDPNNQLAQQCLADYSSQYGEPTFDFYLGAAYDDIHLLAEAIKSVGLDTAKIKNYLYKMKNYSGVIGDYRFDGNGDIVWIDYSFKEIKQGEAVEVQ